jgi:Arc/MetJ family transcription regulator
MRTTLTLDDELLGQAQQISGLTERTQLIREALLALVQRESARRLARLGGTESQLQPIDRPRSDPALSWSIPLCGLTTFGKAIGNWLRHLKPGR